MKLDEATVRDWAAKAGKEVILVGTFGKVPSSKLTDIVGKANLMSVDTDENGTASVYVQAKSGKATDALLKKLWDAGFDEAFVIR